MVCSNRICEDHPSSLPISAKSECFLQKLVESGAISYSPGDKQFEIINPDLLNEEDRKSLENIQDEVLNV